MHEMHSLALPAVKDLVYSARFTCCAGVVELVDTTDSKSVALKSVPVQVRPPVPQAFAACGSVFRPYNVLFRAKRDTYVALANLPASLVLNFCAVRSQT